MFSLNCSITGYQCAFYLYQGKSEQRPPLVSATAYPSYILLQNEKYHNKGYILFTDNWFSSFEQLEICRARQIDVVGTIKRNRSGVPDNFRRGKCPLRVRGQHATLKATPEGGKSVWCTCWLDKKPVYMLHTVPTILGSCNREVNRGGGMAARSLSKTNYNKAIQSWNGGNRCR